MDAALGAGGAVACRAATFLGGDSAGALPTPCPQRRLALPPCRRGAVAARLVCCSAGRATFRAGRGKRRLCANNALKRAEKPSPAARRLAARRAAARATRLHELARAVLRAARRGLRSALQQCSHGLGTHAISHGCSGAAAELHGRRQVAAPACAVERPRRCVDNSQVAPPRVWLFASRLLLCAGAPRGGRALSALAAPRPGLLSPLTQLHDVCRALRRLHLRRMVSVAVTL